MAKIKIFHIVESFGGGVFGSVSQLCNNIDKSMFDVYLLHSLRPETPQNYEKYLDKEVKLVFLSMNREISPYKDLIAFLELFKILKAEKPDVIHLHSSKAGFLGRLAAKIIGIKKVFYSPRGFAFLRNDVSPFKRKLFFLFEYIASKFGGTIIGCSSDEYNYAKKISSASIMISNAVDIKLVEQATKREKMCKNKILIGTSGRISPQKNPQMFRDVAETLGDANTAFTWIGDGELSDIIRNCKTPIEITGWKNREDGLEFVSMLDIYIQISLWEGMPISVLEAMALGKPVVATDIVGNRDLVIHGKTGFIAKNQEEFVMYLKELMDNEQMRIKMGNEARRIIKEQYDVRQIVKQFEKTYQS